MVIFRGAYEPEVTDFLKRTVKPGMTLLDVGAHVGIHALYMAKLLKSAGKVYAFEAWPQNFENLEANLKANPQLASRLVLVPRAVGNHCGQIRFSEGATDGTHHIASDEPGVEVSMTTLDAFVSSHQLKPSVILIDVEGAEGAVLEGAVAMLKESRPQLIIEWHGQRRRDEVSRFLSDLGYEVKFQGKRHIWARHAG